MLVYRLFVVETSDHVEFPVISEDIENDLIVEEIHQWFTISSKTIYDLLSKHHVFTAVLHT